QLIQGLLMQPESAGIVAMPRPDDGTAEGAALTALVEFCAAAPGTVTTAGVMQHFAGSVHEPMLVAALASASDQQMTEEIALSHPREGVRKYWLQVQRVSRSSEAARRDASVALAGELPAEEAERLRQLELARRAPGSRDGA